MVQKEDDSEDPLEHARGAVSSGNVKFGRAAADYSRYRATYPEELYDRLAARGIGLDRGQILDLGTGTGFLAHGFAQRGHTVIGLDVDSALLAYARHTTLEKGFGVEYIRAAAEETPFQAGTFQGVTAGQCWHWFDRPRVAEEVRRILEPRGVLVITHFDWLPIDGSVVTTEDLILEWNPDWRGAGGDGFYPPWLRDVREAGFEDLETFTFDVPYTHEAWRGRVRASGGVGGSLPDEDVASFDAELSELLISCFPEEPLAAPHRSFTLVCRSPE